MNNRLDNLSESTLKSMLSSMEADLLSLKATSQLISGHNIRFFISKSTSTYDWTGTLTLNAGGGYNQYFSVIATADNSDAIFPVIRPVLFVGSPLVRYTQADNWNDPSSNAFYVEIYDGVDQLTPKSKQWFLNIVGDTRNCALKLYIEALDTVSFTITTVSV